MAKSKKKPAKKAAKAAPKKTVAPKAKAPKAKAPAKKKKPSGKVLTVNPNDKHKGKVIEYSREVYGRYTDGTKAVIKKLPASKLAEVLNPENHENVHIPCKQMQPGVWELTGEADQKALRVANIRNLVYLPDGTEMEIVSVPSAS